MKTMKFFYIPVDLWFQPSIIVDNTKKRSSTDIWDLQRGSVW